MSPVPPQKRTDPDRPRGDGLVLIGYRGTGKSSVGRILSERLGRPLVDADARLEAREGRPITAIFAESGEAAFRDLEEQVLEEIVGRNPGAVLSTGGGVILREVNRDRLRDYGLVVWLRASAEVLAARLSANPRALADRPALTSAGTLREVAEVLERRLPLYRATADFEVDTEGKSPSQVAERVRDIWRKSGKI